MKGYTEVRAAMIDAGDILLIEDFEYDESIGKKDWQSNFVKRIKYLRVEQMPSNNGNTRAHDKTGRKYHINVYMNRNFWGAYRRLA